MKKQKARGGIYISIYVQCIRSMLLWLLTGNPPFATPFYLLILARQHDNLRTREQSDRQGTVPTLPRPRRGWVLAGHGHRHPGDSERGAGVTQRPGCKLMQQRCDLLAGGRSRGAGAGGVVHGTDCGVTRALGCATKGTSAPCESSGGRFGFFFFAIIFYYFY